MRPNNDNTESNNDDNNNNNNKNNVDVSSGEFRTISLGIHSELATQRTALMLSTVDDKACPGTAGSVQPAACRKTPPHRDTALDVARQITSLEPEPLFVTVGNNGADMYVEPHHCQHDPNAGNSRVVGQCSRGKYRHFLGGQNFLITHVTISNIPKPDRSVYPFQ